MLCYTILYYTILYYTQPERAAGSPAPSPSAMAVRHTVHDPRTAARLSSI